MSESLGRAVLELVADLNPLKAQLAEGEVAAKEMAATTGRSFKAGITKAALPAAAVLGVVAIGMHKATDAAQEDQVAQARLAAAYKAAGLNAEDYASSLDDTVQSSAALGFKSGDVKAAMGSLIVTTHNHAKALALLSTAQNIARFKHIDLASATKMLVMAQTGSQRATKQLGLVVQASTVQQDKAKAAYKASKAALDAQAGSTSKMTAKQKEAYDQKVTDLQLTLKSRLVQAKYIDTQVTAGKVVDTVNKKLHGQADAYAKTAAGAKEKMGAQMTLLEESLGKVLLPALSAVTGALSSMVGWMTKHSTVAKIAIGIIAGVAAAILAVNIALKLSAVYTKLAAAAQWLFNAAMDANPLALIVVGLVLLGAALVVAWKKSATFRAIVLGVWGAVKSGVMAVLHFFTRTIPAAFQSVLGWVKSHWPMIAVFLSGPFAPLVALATNAFGVRSALTGALQSLWHFVKGIWSTLGAVWGAAWNGVVGVIGAAVNKIIDGINWIIGAWDSLKFHFGGFLGVGAFTVQVPQIAKIGHVALADGGIVTRPTLALMGEAGPEAVIPLSKGHGGLGHEVNITVNGVVGNPREVAVTIGRELQKLKARGVDFQLA